MIHQKFKTRLRQKAKVKTIFGTADGSLQVSLPIRLIQHGNHNHFSGDLNELGQYLLILNTFCVRDVKFCQF